MLKIDIKGVAGSGKTCVAHVIHKALLEAGYKVQHVDDGVTTGWKIDKPEPYIDAGNNDGRTVHIGIHE